MIVKKRFRKLLFDGGFVLKRFLKVLLGIVAFVLFVVLAYVAYVLIYYHRLDDNMVLDVEGALSSQESVPVGTQQSIVSWNIGFGAYEDDYDFFMDGGRQSWAKSREGLEANMSKIGTALKALNAPFNLIQEVDFDATRTYHVDERTYITHALDGQNHVFAQNYDSPFLFYPFYQPHGKSKAGIMTFSVYSITSAVRRSLPIEDSLMKLVDLDRCYSVSRIPTDNGRELVLYNLHLSAYTSDGTIAIEQLEMLLSDMQAEYEKGNYCIGGGDFNKDVVGRGVEAFGIEETEFSWAQPIPSFVFESNEMHLVAPYDESNPIASCRNPSEAYWAGQYQITVDGFLVSPNVTVVESYVVDARFECSDHNPVYMTFVLEP